MNRRDLLKLGVTAGALASGRTVIADTSSSPPTAASSSSSPTVQPTPSASLDAEYIVVGSGAGGGTVAARLAESGYTVLLLEAGADAKTSGDPVDSDDYDVPAFNARSTENEQMRWDFFVRHYGDDVQQRRDPKYRDEWNGKKVDGVLYPRAGTLGGCTAHNALILVYPHDADWNELADLTGDPSWRSDRMREYFVRLENCHHRPLDRALSKLGINRSRHGWGGWLHTERAVPRAAIRDRNLRDVVIESARAALRAEAEAKRFRLGLLSNEEADPNDWQVIRSDTIGVRYTPLTTRNHARHGTRERLLDVKQRYPERLKVVTDALATRVLVDQGNRAIGVEYLEGERLYRAHARPSNGAGVRREAYASREVIVSGGAFNTPQLLLLSGIGPREQLTRHGLQVRVDLPGVGRNLQDRYEVSVVNRMAFDAWSVLEGATFTRNDAQYREWASRREGVYTTNGALLSIVMRSSVERPIPDLFLYSVLADFHGYFPGYSDVFPKNPNCLSWVVLKGHTANTAGEVTLRSSDPRDPPLINFRYFSEGNDAKSEDLQSVVDGMKFARRLAEPLRRQQLIAKEEIPGDAVQTDDELRQHVRDNAWGHHASCSCPIGSRERGGVLSGDLKVHGVEGLRIVDASVFPRIPGLFLASAVYMVGEKAADVIIADAKRNVPARRT